MPDRPSSRRCSRRSSAAPFDDPDWLFEVKWDGFRVEAVVDGGSGPAVDPRRAGRGALLRAVPRAADLDRRARARSSTARSSRSTSRASPTSPCSRPGSRGGESAAEPNPFVYEVFDLLHLDGRSLLDEPLEERRRLLAERPPTGPARPAERARRGRRDRVLRGRPGAGPRGDHGQGPPLAVRPGQADRPLAEGQDPSRAGARRRRLGRRARARPSTSARSSSASTRTARCATPARSAPGSRTTTAPSCWPPSRRSPTTEPPFAPPPPRAAARDAQWLRPELVIRAEFAGWTGDGLVRQAAYKGIELEKDPRKVIRERPKD